VDKLSIIFNGDLGIDTERPDGADDATFYGVSLAAGYRITDTFGIALRGEALFDDNASLYVPVTGGEAFDKVMVTTETLTFDYKPAGDNLILRLDLRAEQADEEIFMDGKDEPTKNWMQAVVGVVVTSG
jgi:hypothetical protein